MELSAVGREFLDALDPAELHVGNGSNDLPVWVGVAPEEGKVFKIYANGLATGFGDGWMIFANGLALPGGAGCCASSEQLTRGNHVMVSGEGRIECYEADPQPATRSTA